MRKNILIILLILVAVVSTVLILLYINVYRGEETIEMEIQIENITITEGERMVRCVKVCPKGEGPFPAILLIHGGAGGNWKTTYGLVTSEPIISIAKMGFIILSVDYGPNGIIDTGVGNIKLVGDDINDTLIAYRYLTKLDIVDKDKIFTLGGSHGGYVSLMMGVFSKVKLAGIIDAYGPTNLTAMELYLHGGINESIADILIDYSPVTWVENYTAPILMIHGKKDELVPINQSYELADLLKKHGKEHYLYVYNEPHAFLFDKTSPSYEDAWNKIKNFLLDIINR